MHSRHGITGLTLAAGLMLLLVTQCLAGEANLNRPAENIARGKSVQFAPAPNYKLCTDPDDLRQLTDGVYTKGYFWTQKETVGWSGHKPIVITIDLGRVEPIRGVSFNTAAGTAGVQWPVSVLIAVSDDGRRHHVAGELVSLGAKEGRPPAEGYAVHRYWTDELKAHGRYVSVIISSSDYAFTDEIEVYRGENAWVNQPPPGEAYDSPQALFAVNVLTNCIRYRLGDDAHALREMLAKSALEAPARQKLTAELDTIDDAVAHLAPARADKDFRAILPLNDLHRRLFKAQAALWRAAGAPALVLWRSGPWDPLTVVHPLPPEKMAPLELILMQNEYRAAAFNISATAGEDLTLKLNIEGLPGGTSPDWITVHEVEWTDTDTGRPVAAALPEARREGGATLIRVCPGLTRQVWLTVHPKGIAPGTYQGRLTLQGGGEAVETPFTVRVSKLRFPERPTLHLGGWDYTDQEEGLGVNARNRDAFLAHLREHFVDSPWGTGGVMPFGKYNDVGRLIAPPSTARFETWIQRWPEARQYCVFASVIDQSLPFAPGTPAFNTAVGEWVRFWANYARGKGIRPDQLALLLVDEPHTAESDARILPWAKAIHAAGTGVLVWEDPTHSDPFAANQAMLAECDVLCPNRPMFLAGERVRDYYVKHLPARARLAFYSCSGPVRALDPYAYHRLQAWTCWQYGATQGHFWSFGDSGAGSSWNEYTAPHREYTPLFLDESSVTAGKQMEAIREGVEDYEYFVMLRGAVAVAEKAGRSGTALARAKSLLADGARRVCEAPGVKGLNWTDPKDRGQADRVRLEMLETLEALEARAQ